jgi:tripartite-type tricarboxylate transporter receptor subunit TctC
MTHSMPKSLAFVAVLSAALGSLAPFSATAQTYPARPIRLVVPFPAGGPSDVLARVVGEKMSQAFAQPVIVDNRPGANTIIGAEIVAKAPPDGYTLLLAIDSTLAMNQYLYSKLPYDPLKDFSAVTQLMTSPIIIATDAAKGPKTVEELIRQAKANPGKISYGGGTIISQLAGELLKRTANVDMVYVPYKGSPPTTQALLSNDVTFIFNGVTSDLPHIKSGKFRVLANTSARPLPVLPDVPRLGDMPGFAGFDVAVWLGLVAPAGTPNDVLDKLYGEVTRIYTLPDVREKLSGAGIDPVSSSPTEFAAFIRRDAERWSKLIREAGIKLD